MELADKYINACVGGTDTLLVHLRNGVKLEGVITFADASGIVLARNENNQLVMRDAIATVCPPEPVSAEELSDE